MLKKIFETYENVSLRKAAKALGIEGSYQQLLKASHKPVEGEVFSPSAINWKEINAVLERKGITKKDIGKVDWEAYNTAQAFGVGRTLPYLEDINVGSVVYLRKEPTTPYEVIYKTETHVVIMAQGSSAPRAMSLNTFGFQGPSFQPRAPKDTEAGGEDQ